MLYKVVSLPPLCFSALRLRLRHLHMLAGFRNLGQDTQKRSTNIDQTAKAFRNGQQQWPGCPGRTEHVNWSGSEILGAGISVVEDRKIFPPCRWSWTSFACSGLFDLPFSLSVALSLINFRVDVSSYYGNSATILQQDNELWHGFAPGAGSKQYRKQETASGNVLCLFGGDGVVGKYLEQSMSSTASTTSETNETGNNRDDGIAMRLPRCRRPIWIHAKPSQVKSG